MRAAALIPALALILLFSCNKAEVNGTGTPQQAAPAGAATKTDKEAAATPAANQQAPADKQAPAEKQVTDEKQVPAEKQVADEKQVAKDGLIDGSGEVKPEEKKVQAPANPSGNPVVMFETNLGNIKIELYPEKTPITVANFLQYVEEGFYNGLIFHRVVPGFVIQGGGFTPDLQRRETRDGITNEAQQGIKNLRGTISMARTPERSSGTSQFFISLRNNPALDYRGEFQSGWGYAAFGQVIEGMDVVDAIAAIPTGSRGPFPGAEVPMKDAIINKAYIVK